MLVDVTIKFDHARARRLIDDRIIERTARFNGLTAALEADLDHHAVVNVEMACSPAIERREQFGEREFGQVAEPAEVDAEHWNPARAHQPRRAEHRAIAAEHDDQIHWLGQWSSRTESGGQATCSATGSTARKATPCCSHHARSSRTTAMASGFCGRPRHQSF